MVFNFLISIYFLRDSPYKTALCRLVFKIVGFPAYLKLFGLFDENSNLGHVSQAVIGWRIGGPSCVEDFHFLEDFFKIDDPCETFCNRLSFVVKGVSVNFLCVYLEILWVASVSHLFFGLG